ncbi:uncharacterized protein KY384_008265 [Bacidia gigantensis]|uniref:uncharacterized protein n=1 Tax=Bacidia gigantensis TaxID=2732470 RepID=UPI001D0480F1|nr:uncharacterized protein KY384_008265 [Bacidia gigantensis]KAG8526836.1 hypothetical protein KY384_008265 [Bacidia gigantensis]
MLALYSTEIARRSTWTCLACSALALGPQRPPIAISQRHGSPPVHQRKHSSSKASNPPKHDLRALANATKAPAEDQESAKHSEPQQAANSRTRKRRLKGDSIEPLLRSSGIKQVTLPAVPSTQQIQPLDIQLASFFSQHRPLSVPHIIPPIATTDGLSNLFISDTSSNSKHGEVIQTLSSAVDTLDQAVAQQEESRAPEDLDLGTAITQLLSSTTSESNVESQTQQINMSELAKNFRPFMPPPPPVPYAAMREAAKKTVKEQRRQTQKTAWSSQLTVYVDEHPSGALTFKPHFTPLVQIPVTSKSLSAPKYEKAKEYTSQQLPGSSSLPRAFLNRMLDRQVTYGDRVEQKFGYRTPTLQALSVRRQRKLKMKKHKYKKVMKRTRNVRKRIGKV